MIFIHDDSFDMSLIELFHMLPTVVNANEDEVCAHIGFAPKAYSNDEIISDLDGEFEYLFAETIEDEWSYISEGVSKTEIAEVCIARGRSLNSALRVLCATYNLNEPFWDAENSKKLEARLQQEQTNLSIGLMNLYNLITVLLKGNYIKTRKGIDAGNFITLLDESIPHKTGFRSLEIIDFLTLGSDANALLHHDPFPIFCLFDIIYLSLRYCAIDEGKNRLKQCARCGRLFFSKDGKDKFCFLDAPNHSCSHEDAKERNRLSRRNNAKKDKIRNLILKNGTDEEELSFRKEYNRIKKAIEAQYSIPKERYDKEFEYLDEVERKYSDN